MLASKKATEEPCTDEPSPVHDKPEITCSCTVGCLNAKCKDIDEFLNSDVPNFKCLCATDIVYLSCKEFADFVISGMATDEQHPTPQNSPSLVAKNTRENALGTDTIFCLDPNRERKREK
ncbi:uncharacterized protein G2W53_041250 [Senna tora]|uniref:Uncharacterized protein n=1 Tax=Senna tora TaxID=362788 RepID=A0A834SRM8_9FABA|nr:uncharacterized protein G2W53_041250 [Senna tora]